MCECGTRFLGEIRLCQIVSESFQILSLDDLGALFLNPTVLESPHSSPKPQSSHYLFLNLSMQIFTSSIATRVLSVSLRVRGFDSLTCSDHSQGDSKAQSLTVRYKSEDLATR